MHVFWSGDVSGLLEEGGILMDLRFPLPKRLRVWDPARCPPPLQFWLCCLLITARARPGPAFHFITRLRSGQLLPPG